MAHANRDELKVETPIETPIETPPEARASFLWADDSMYMSVSGYTAILPWRKFTDDDELNILLNKGVARVLITSLQALVAKAVKEGKSHAAIQASIDESCINPKVATRGDLQTVGAKRAEIVSGLLQESLAKAGKTVNEATFNHLLPQFAAKHRARVDDALHAWKNLYVKPTVKVTVLEGIRGTVDTTVNVDDLIAP
jgi:hypothetical protein